MKPGKRNISPEFFSSFDDTPSQIHLLYILADKVDWKHFEAAFVPQYCQDNSVPREPIRLMVALLMLKHIRNISHESVMEQWSENNYYQYFSGEKSLDPEFPCQTSGLVHFRKHIGEEGFP